jgi:hypothetical protein
MSKDIKKPAGETRRYVGIDLGDKESRIARMGGDHARSLFQTLSR